MPVRRAASKPGFMTNTTNESKIPATARPRRSWFAPCIALIVLAVLTFGPGRSLAMTLVHGSPSTAEPGSEATAEDPEVIARFEAAQAAAAQEGYSLSITSGWRSDAEQERLIADARATYGSEEEAQRYVLPSSESAHVHGTALDVGNMDAAFWLEQHQEEFGLCRTYANEWWHYELIGEIGAPCPPMHEDASHGWQ